VELRAYGRLIRRRYRITALCVLLGLAAAVVFLVLATPKYTASTQLFVATKNGSDVTDLVQGSTFGQDQVRSYAAIINSPQVTDQVAKLLHDGLSGKQIGKEIHATAPSTTALLDVSVVDTSPARAALIAENVSLVFKAYAARLSSGSGLNSPVKITVVRDAVAPNSQSSPRTGLDIALGLVIGLVVGLAAAVARELLDRTVTTAEQVRALVDLPVIGTITYDPDTSSHPLIVSTSPRSARAEAFRQLRTNLRFFDPDHRPRSIAIASSAPGEGKTTTVVNLAIALADAGLHVCLVDGDLRRPKAAEYLGAENAVGLTDVLIGSVSLDAALQPWGPRKNLELLASGPLPPNPTELLDSRAMHDIIAELERRFDLVLIDSPPLLPVSDGALLANAASGALFIVRHGKTRRDHVTRAVDTLRVADATIYGVVLTFVPTKGPDADSYNYGYDYGPASSRSRPAADATSGDRSNTEVEAAAPLAGSATPVGATADARPRTRALANKSARRSVTDQT
jgi:capsular exopolysaccharide synthesis family protein